MMNGKLVLSVAICMMAATETAAQKQGDTTLKTSVIEVIQAYKPHVKKAPKPEWMPLLPKSDTSHPVFNFEVPQQTLFYSYSPEPITPMTLGKVDKPLPFGNYVKAGVGNLSTLYFDAGIGNISGEFYQAAVHAHHLSQKGQLKNQQTSSTGADASGILQLAKTQWHAALGVNNNQYQYYGYDHDLFTFSNDSLKQRYTSVYGSLAMQSTQVTHQFYWSPSVTASLYNASNNASETGISIKAPFTKALDSTLDLAVVLTGDITHLSRPGNGVDNNLLAIKPGVELHLADVTGHGYIAFAAGKDGTNYILPDITAKYTLHPAMTIGGGWQANVERNTYQTLTTDNPYMNANYLVKQSRRDEIFGQLQGSLGNHITYSTRLSWWAIKNLPLYLTEAPDARKFAVLYEDINALSVMASARYTLAAKWSAGINGSYYVWYNGKYAQPWHQPSLKVTGDIAVNVTPKLLVTGYLYLLGGVHAMGTSGNTLTLQPVTDLGASGEYTLTKRLNVFAQVNNLLNNKYERWQGYQAYGFNIYGGVRLKF